MNDIQVCKVNAITNFDVMCVCVCTYQIPSQQRKLKSQHASHSCNITSRWRSLLLAASVFLNSKYTYRKYLHQKGLQKNPLGNNHSHFKIRNRIQEVIGGVWNYYFFNLKVGKHLWIKNEGFISLSTRTSTYRKYLKYDPQRGI